MKLFGLLLLATAVSAQVSILDTAAAEPTLSTLAALITSGDYPTIEALLSDSTSTLTVFAPSNTALTNTPLGTDVALNTAILQYHVLGVEVMSTGLVEGSNFVNTLMTDATYVTLDGAGQFIDVMKNTSGVYVDWGSTTKAMVTTADVNCTNGVVHIVDAVITPFPALTSATATAAGLSSLVGAVVNASLVPTIDETASLTIFAPLDSAFAEIGDATTLSNAKLTALLTHHVVAGVAHSTDLSDGQVLTTVEGQNLTVSIVNGEVFITAAGGRKAKVVAANVPTKNGVVHVIDKVLLPQKTIVETADATPSLATLVSVLQTAGYEETLNALNGVGSLTVFAPDDAAFANSTVDKTDIAMTTAVLMYHVVGETLMSTDLTAGSKFVETLMTDAAYVTLGGAGQFIDVMKNTSGVYVDWGSTTKAMVTTADVECFNGVVHIVSEVITPFPALTSATASAAGLSSLVEALGDTSLVATVDETASVTIFAPTDAAFFSSDTRDLPNADISMTLKYHVVAGVAHSADLVDGQNLTTVQGETLTVGIAAGVVTLTGAQNSARVVMQNVPTKNGVVHVIDTVLFPSTVTLPGDGSPAAGLIPSLTSLLFIGAIVFAQR